MKKKIMHLVVGLGIGGTEQMLLKTLPNLSHFENSVCCMIRKGRTGDELKKAGVPVHYLKFRSVFDWSAISRFRKAVRQHQPDVLVAYSIRAAIFSRFFGRFFGIKKIICSERGSLESRKLLRYIDRLTQFLVSRYFCVSKTLKKEMLRFLYPQDKIWVIPNGVDLQIYDFAIDKKKKKTELDLKNKIVLTYTANLRIGKGHIDLIDACAKLRNNKWILLLLGEDQGEQENIEKKIEQYGLQNNVKILGQRNDVLKILRITDIFLFPSESEGMSNALLEAMASKCPIIANDISENRELISNKKSGVLINTKNADLFAKEIGKLILDKNARNKYGKNAYNKIERHFQIRTVVGRMEKVLDI